VHSVCPIFLLTGLSFLREVSLYVSGTGWRAYDDFIGQPIFYSGFSEHIKTLIMSAALLQAKIAQLADMRVAVEEKQGLLNQYDGDFAVKKAQRRAVLVQGLQEVAEKLTDNMICKFESKAFIRGAYYFVTQLLLRAYHQGIHVSAEEVMRLRSVAEEAARKKQSIIFLPCHRSHVDYVSMQLLCYRLGLALPVVVAGDNLNFPLVGNFLQHAGRSIFNLHAYLNTHFVQGLCTSADLSGTTSSTQPLSKPTSTSCCKAATTSSASSKAAGHGQGSCFPQSLVFSILC
jgi:hypothetical protein